MVRQILTVALFALSACATPVQPAPAAATPQQLHDRVGAFAQPTQDGRLAALKAQIEAAGLAYKVETFEGDRPAPALGSNVSVRVGPKRGPEILLVAHYDAVELPGGTLVDGVVDNAASVVVMIEATRRVAGRTKHPVRLLMTDEEELGLLGAEAWIESHGVDGLAAVINADINANGDTLMYGLNNGVQSAAITDAVKALCVARAMSCLDFPEYPPSDDRAFSAAGAPTISLGHQPKAEAEKLRAILLDPPISQPPDDALPEIFHIIHTPNDALSHVEASTLAQAADFITALVMKLDGELPL